MLFLHVLVLIVRSARGDRPFNFALRLSQEAIAIKKGLIEAKERSLPKD
jgi:hypothetical protein